MLQDNFKLFDLLQRRQSNTLTILEIAQPSPVQVQGCAGAGEELLM